MKRHRYLLTAALILVLGFAVWTLAVGFTSASFKDGDVLSAAELNTIINDNFAAAQAALADLEAKKFDRSGGVIDGSVEIREEPTADPAVTLDAAARTVTTANGSGLPAAYGFVAQQGWETDGTDNFSAERVEEGIYEIEFDGINYAARDYTASVTAAGLTPVFISSESEDGRMRVHAFDQSGDRVNTGFHFVIYENRHTYD